MTRAFKIEQAIEKRIYANGGHWVKLAMKNGSELYIQRCNFVSFEYLSKEKFNVKLNGNKILSQVSISDLAKYINENF